MQTDSRAEEVRPSFSELLSGSPVVARLEELKILKPTPVQAEAIPPAIEGKDLVVEAQTGSGKTLAFILPIISRMQQESSGSGTFAIVVTPTRELALQVQAVVNSLSPEINAACIIGGANPRAQIRQLKNDARIVIGTPGRLIDFLNRRFISLKSCKMFVLDEADEMLSMGFLDEVREILRLIPRPRQGLFFSATISGRVLSLASAFLKTPKTIVIPAEGGNIPIIEHLFVRVDGGVTTKATVLCKLLAAQPAKSAIVFCNTKSDTELVEAFLKRRGFDAEKINSDLSQRERDKVLANLRSGKLKLLIATDVAARGIDIKELETVFNYSIHPESEIYVHRTGRTGRAGASGRAISLVGPQDFGSFHSLKRQLPIDLQEIGIPDIEVPTVTPAGGRKRDAA